MVGTSSTVSVDPYECGRVLDDAEGILQQIFLFYCSFGERLNTDALSGAKFLKFVRDCKLLKESRSTHGLTRATVDLIFTHVLKSRPAGAVEEAAFHSRLNFDDFRECIGELSARVHHSEEKLSYAIARLLSEDILPNAQRMQTTFTMSAEELYLDSQVTTVIKACRRPLGQLFAYYSSLEIPDAAGNKWTDILKANSTLSSKEIFLFVKDFDILPSMLSKPDIQQCFNDSCQDEDELNYDEFVECVVRMACIRYSNFRNDKVECLKSFLYNIDNSSGWRKIFENRQGWGKSVDQMSFSTALQPLFKGTTRKALPESEDEATANLLCQQLLEDHEDDLRQVFTYFSSFGDKTSVNGMGSSNFYKFTRECGLLDQRFAHVDVDLLYKSVTKSRGRGKVMMQFSEFNEALLQIVHRKFGNQNRVENLEALLDIVLSKQHYDESFMAHLDLGDMDGVDVIQQCRDSLQGIYETYASGPNQNVMTTDDFRKFAQTFDIFPTIISRNSLSQVYMTCTQGGQETMSFDKFLESIILIADRAFPKSVGAVRQVGTMLRHISECDGLRKVEKAAGLVAGSSRYKLIGLAADRALTHKRKSSRAVSAYVGPSLLMQAKQQRTEIIVDEHRQDLLDIFDHYAAIGERTHTDTLSSAKLKKFAKDCKLIDSTCSQADIDILFVKTTKSNSGGKQENRLKFDQFIQVLIKLGEKRYPEHSIKNTSSEFVPLELLLANHVMPFALRDQAADVLSMLTLEDMDVSVSVLRKCEKQFRMLFESYQSTMPSGPAEGNMNWKNFLSFVTNFEILPSVVSQSQALLVFKERSREDVYGSKSENVLLFDDFLKSLAHLALAGFAGVEGSPSDKVVMIVRRMEASPGRVQMERHTGLVHGSYKSFSFENIIRLPSSPKSGGDDMSKQVAGLGLRRTGTVSTPLSPDARFTHTISLQGSLPTSPTPTLQSPRVTGDGEMEIDSSHLQLKQSGHFGISSPRKSRAPSSPSPTRNRGASSVSFQEPPSLSNPSQHRDSVMSHISNVGSAPRKSLLEPSGGHHSNDGARACKEERKTKLQQELQECQDLLSQVLVAVSKDAKEDFDRLLTLDRYIHQRTAHPEIEIPFPNVAAASTGHNSPLFFNAPGAEEGDSIQSGRHFDGETTIASISQTLSASMSEASKLSHDDEIGSVAEVNRIIGKFHSGVSTLLQVANDQRNQRQELISVMTHEAARM